VHPALPEHLSDLLERPERTTPLPNELAGVQAFVRSVARS
jgi:threonine synthase